MGTAVIAPIVSSRRNGDLQQAYGCDVAARAVLLSESSASVLLIVPPGTMSGIRDQRLDGSSLWGTNVYLTSTLARCTRALLDFGNMHDDGIGSAPENAKTL